MFAWPRTSSPILFNLTRSRFEDPSVRKDVKNEGRSEEVYENKGQHDTMPEKKCDFVSEIAGF